MTHIKVTSVLVCILLTAHMTAKEAIRFMKNEDTSTITYKQFNKAPRDTYPTFSICFTDEQFYSGNNGLIYRHHESKPGGPI